MGSLARRKIDMEQLIMTPRLFKEFGIHVCDDQIISTHRACPKKIRGLLDKTLVLQDEGEVVAMKDYFKSVITGEGNPCRMKRLANGDKSTNELRILERARFWKSVLFRGGTIVNDVNASMPLVSYVNDYNGIKVWFEDTLDVFPCNYKGVLASLILYLTSNIDSTYFSPSFPDKCSESCWGDPRFINKTRALVQHHLIRNFKLSHQVKKYHDWRHQELFYNGWNAAMKDPQVFYIVADLRPEKDGIVNTRDYRFECTAERLGLCEDLAREAAIVYNTLLLQGWDQISPNETSCTNCPLKCKIANETKRI